MNHKHTKCIFFHQGMVLNEACDKAIAHCFCDLDEMEEDKPCTADACRYYNRGVKREVAPIYWHEARSGKEQKNEG